MLKKIQNFMTSRRPGYAPPDLSPFDAFGNSPPQNLLPQERIVVAATDHTPLNRSTAAINSTKMGGVKRLATISDILGHT